MEPTPGVHLGEVAPPVVAGVETPVQTPVPKAAAGTPVSGLQDEDLEDTHPCSVLVQGKYDELRASRKRKDMNSQPDGPEPPLDMPGPVTTTFDISVPPSNDPHPPAESKAVVWDPSLLWPHSEEVQHAFKCIACGGKAARDGRTKVRRVRAGEPPVDYYVIGAKYRHRDCPGSGKVLKNGKHGATVYDAKAEAVLARLPPEVAAFYPAALKQRTAAIGRRAAAPVHMNGFGGMGTQLTAAMLAQQLGLSEAQLQQAQAAAAAQATNSPLAALQMLHNPELQRAIASGQPGAMPEGEDGQPQQVPPAAVGPWAQDPFDVAPGVVTDAEIKLFFELRMRKESLFPNGAINYQKMAADFNLAVSRQVQELSMTGREFHQSELLFFKNAARLAEYEHSLMVAYANRATQQNAEAMLQQQQQQQAQQQQGQPPGQQPPQS